MRCLGILNIVLIMTYVANLFIFYYILTFDCMLIVNS